MPSNWYMNVPQALSISTNTPIPCCGCWIVWGGSFKYSESWGVPCPIWWPLLSISTWYVCSLDSFCLSGSFGSISSASSTCYMQCFLLACCLSPLSEIDEKSHWSHLNPLLVASTSSLWLRLSLAFFSEAFTVSLIGDILFSATFSLTSFSGTFTVSFIEGISF